MEVNRVLQNHPELRNCRDDRCWLRLGDLLEANRLLSVRLIRAVNNTWDVNILNYAVDSVELVKTVSTRCNVCTRNDLWNEIVNDLSIILQNDPKKPLCKVKIESVPEGSTVYVDGTEVGTAPFKHSLAAGRHGFSVTRDRFAKGEAESECAANTETQIAFTLTPEKSTFVTRAKPAGDGTTNITLPPPPPGNRRKLLIAAGAVSIGLFVASTVGLIYEASRNGNSVCTPGQRCGEQIDSTSGIALSAVGMGVSAVGVGLSFGFAFGKSERQEKRVTVSQQQSPSATPEVE
jgi:hypothetical protein